MGKEGTQILGRLGQRVRKGEPGTEKPDDKTSIPWGLWQAASLPRTPEPLPSPPSFPFTCRDRTFTSASWSLKGARGGTWLAPSPSRVTLPGGSGWSPE